MLQHRVDVSPFWLKQETRAGLIPHSSYNPRQRSLRKGNIMNSGEFLFVLVVGLFFLFWVLGAKPLFTTLYIKSQLRRWRKLYRREFGIELGKVVIPKQRLDFDRLIVIAAGLTISQVLAVLRKYFAIWPPDVTNFDVRFNKNDRVNTETYAIWTHDEFHARRKLMDLSAYGIRAGGVPTETLIEHLLHELCYYTETGEHLDRFSVALCTGSLGFNDDVPCVSWRSLHDMMYISSRGLYCHTATADFCPREVVSLPAKASAQAG